MFKPFYGECTGTEKLKGCGCSGNIRTKRLLCDKCDHKMKQAKKDLKPIKKEIETYEPSMLKVFLEIWNERKPRFCVTCKCTLKHFFVGIFSHVLSRGAFPRFKLYKKNIAYQCYGCHQEWEFGDRTRHTEMQRLQQELKEEYYQPKETLK